MFRNQALGGRLRHHIVLLALVPLLSVVSLFTPLFTQQVSAITQAEVLNRARAWSILNGVLDNIGLLDSGISNSDVDSCALWGGFDNDKVYVGYHVTGGRSGDTAASWEALEGRIDILNGALASVGINGSCRGLLEALGYTSRDGSMNAPDDFNRDKALSNLKNKVRDDAFFGAHLGDENAGEAIAYSIMYYYLKNVCGWDYRNAYVAGDKSDTDEGRRNREAEGNSWKTKSGTGHYYTYTFENNKAGFNTYSRNSDGILGYVRVGGNSGFTSPSSGAQIFCGGNTDNTIPALLNNQRFANKYAELVRPGGAATAGTCKERYPITSTGGGQAALEQQLLNACDEGFKNKTNAAYCNKFSGNSSLLDACRYGQNTATGGATDVTPPEDTSQQKTDENSCAIQGIGWIVCGVLNFMAGLTDGAYAFIAELLKVAPITNSGSSGLYKAWEIMRNFANVAFVIAFLIIIFSQLTSAGISNYGVKKLLPRLIVSAVLVNVSFWLCAIAVDLSNIFGASLKGLFDGIGATITLDPQTTFTSGGGWLGIVGTILAITGGAIIILYVGLSILVPLLTACLIIALTIVVVLVIRQALIVLLIVISPLAFVAYLLPNTESLYRRWFTLFQTMLLLYPIISLIFGASALAAKIVQAS